MQPQLVPHSSQAPRDMEATHTEILYRYMHIIYITLLNGSIPFPVQLSAISNAQERCRLYRDSVDFTMDSLRFNGRADQLPLHVPGDLVVKLSGGPGG